jgi:hypothetical protein
VATDVRGKVIASQSNGTVVIAQRGAVNTGYRPPSGCRVRIPNIMVSSSTSTNWTLNLLSASTTSWDFTTTGAGAVRLDKTIGNWYLNFSQAYSLEIVDSAIQGDLTISECATAPIVRRCGVGIATNEDRNPLTISSCFAGGTIEDCVTFKYENESGDVGWSISDCDGFTISGCKTLNCGDNTAATLTRGSTGIYNVTLTRITNTTITNHANIGGGFSLVACSDVTITNYTYADCLENRTTNSTNGVDACVMQGGTNRCMLDGFANYGALADVHPYNNICSFSACYDCEVRNIGTSAAPYNCGSVNACGNAVSFAGNDQRNIARRVYAQNTRTGPVATVNSSSGGQAINVWGDYADAVALAALDFAYRGGRMAGSVTGQTSVYGTHWSDHFTAATTGLIRLHANEPTSSSALECSITAGTPRFTSTGQVKLTTVGDQVTWTMPYFAIGHTSLATLTFTGTNQANHNLEFQVDTGAGFGAWQTLDNANLAAVGAIDPTTGVRLKIRATCTVAATTNAITYITVNTVTNATDQQIQYPLPGGTLTISSVVAGSRVSVIRESDSSYLANVYPSGTEVVVEYPVAAPFDVTILILKQGRLPFKLSAFNLAGGEQAVQSVQPIDRTFNNP